MNKFFITVIGFVTVVCLGSIAMAQERAAGGTVETQMTWHALSSLVEDAKTKTEAVSLRVDQIVKCNNKAMAYAPGAGADADGCIENSKLLALQVRATNLETRTNSVVNCGASGYFFNGSTCVAIPNKPIVTSNCGWVMYTTGNHDLVCPANKVQTGLRFEGPTFTHVIDNQIGPEITHVLCCSLSH